jgi:hypothetical protein
MLNEENNRKHVLPKDKVKNNQKIKRAFLKLQTKKGNIIVRYKNNNTSQLISTPPITKMLCQIYFIEIALGVTIKTEIKKKNKKI